MAAPTSTSTVQQPKVPPSFAAAAPVKTPQPQQTHKPDDFAGGVSHGPLLWGATEKLSGGQRHHIGVGLDQSTPAHVGQSSCFGTPRTPVKWIFLCSVLFD